MVHKAALLTKSVLRAVKNNVAAETKADDSPVTVADFAAQALIISALHALYPSDQFLGEESAAQLRSNGELADRVWGLVCSTAAAADDANQSPAHAGPAQSSHLQHAVHRENLVFPTTKADMLDAIDRGTNEQTATGRIWVMDPVDGTATFMTGNQYAVCLCLLVDGVQQVAVIACPNLPWDPEMSTKVHEDLVDEAGFGVVLSAVNRQGTWVRGMLRHGLGEPHRVEHRGAREGLSQLNFVECALGSTSLSQAEHRAVAETLGANWPGTVVWSQQIKYVALALGAAHVMVRLPTTRARYTHVWDHAGGLLLFQEVGGIVKDIDGHAIDLSRGRRILGTNNYGLIAAMPWAFDAVHRAVRDVLGRRTL